MKIGIYDKWLRELGGGEKVACVMAETLSKSGHEVDLISNSFIEINEIERKMGVDLSKVELVQWKERSYEKLTPETKEYDLFINVSFMDHLPSKAKKSIYYILFPTPIKRTLLGFIKYEKILPFLRKFLIIPEVTKGLQHIDEVIVRGGKWLSKENIFVLRNLPEKFQIKIRIYAEQLTLESLNSINLTSDDSSIILTGKYIEHGNNVLAYDLKGTKRQKDSAVSIKINIDDTELKSGFGLVSMTVFNYRYFLWNIIKRYLPAFEMALYGSSGYKPAAGLSTYNMFLADSKFSAYWTKKYWKENADVLYPPVDVQEFKPGKKKNNILSVGRFFVGGHSKKQDVLVEVFKTMVDKKLIDNSWELHLVGGVAKGERHSEYVEKIKKSAKGYPIYFHISAPFNELKKLYSAAKIYWHAAGYGESKNEPILMEHFGITPVEAMAAGAVPIVYGEGGLKETVSNDKNQIWKNTDELIKNTVDFISNEKKWKMYSKNMEKMAKNYSSEVFIDKLLKYVEDIR